MLSSVLGHALGILWCFVALEAPAATREITFGPGGRIAGQLDKPTGDGPFPLVILIAAGGNLDRNGSSLQLEAFRDIYVPLVKIATDAGWAIFRYDRQGTGNSRPSNRNEIIDALDAVIVARELPDVDRDRVVIIAHASGTEMLQRGYEFFEETIGFRALRGVVLLSNTVSSQAAGRMAGNLLVIIGQSDEAEESAISSAAVSVHRRNYPDRAAEAMVITDADHALCDTTLEGWRGWVGTPGSCEVPRQVYDAVGRFLRDIHSSAGRKR